MLCRFGVLVGGAYIIRQTIIINISILAEKFVICMSHNCNFGMASFAPMFLINMILTALKCSMIPTLGKLVWDVKLKAFA